MVTITEPGIYEIPELEYHDDPVPAGSFSSTQAKRILKSPAHLRHYLDSPRVERADFDFGHIVHAGVLGVGLDIEILNFPDWRTKAAKEARDACHARGSVPMLAKDVEAAEAAIEAIPAHPLAGQIFAAGQAERSAFAVDPVTGLWLRSRFDWIGDGVLVDLKTAVDGEPGAFERAGRRLGYDVQQAFYRYVYKLATGDDLEFAFVTVEKSAPYLVDMHMPADWQVIGEPKMRRAIDLYAECLASDEWPGRPPVINRTESPLWAFDDEELEVS